MFIYFLDVLSIGYLWFDIIILLVYLRVSDIIIFFRDTFSTITMLLKDWWYSYSWNRLLLCYVWISWSCYFIIVFLVTLYLWFYGSIMVYLWFTLLETNFILYQLALSLCNYQHQHHLFNTLQLIYWHFVEVIWILLSYVLYN